MQESIATRELLQRALRHLRADGEHYRPLLAPLKRFAAAILVRVSFVSLLYGWPSRHRELDA